MEKFVQNSPTISALRMNRNIVMTECWQLQACGRRGVVVKSDIRPAQR
jgi:hypothetical protein